MNKNDLYEYMKKCGRSTVAEAQFKLGANYKTVRQGFFELERRGFVRLEDDLYFVLVDETKVFVDSNINFGVVLNELKKKHKSYKTAIDLLYKNKKLTKYMLVGSDESIGFMRAQAILLWLVEMKLAKQKGSEYVSLMSEEEYAALRGERSDEKDSPVKRDDEKKGDFGGVDDKILRAGDKTRKKISSKEPDGEALLHLIFHYKDDKEVLFFEFLQNSARLIACREQGSDDDEIVSDLKNNRICPEYIARRAIEKLMRECRGEYDVNIFSLENAKLKAIASIDEKLSEAYVHELVAYVVDRVDDKIYERFIEILRKAI